MVKEHLPTFPIFKAQYVSAFIRILDALAKEEGKYVWLEKTPRHLHHIEEIQRHVPNVKFMHVVRNGTDNIASLYEVTQRYPQWGGARSIDACIDRWITDLEITKRYSKEKNHLIIRYEQLVASPVTVLREACCFLGLSFRHEMLDRYNVTAKKVISNDEPWKASVSDHIRNANGQKFTRVFTEAERRHVIRRISSIDPDPNAGLLIQ